MNLEHITCDIERAQQVVAVHHRLAKQYGAGHKALEPISYAYSDLEQARKLVAAAQGRFTDNAIDSHHSVRYVPEQYLRNTITGDEAYVAYITREGHAICDDVIDSNVDFSFVAPYVATVEMLIDGKIEILEHEER